MSYSSYIDICAVLIALLIFHEMAFTMMCFFCSRNLLTVLPKYLFNLPLKVLLVSNNKLVSIPDEIGKAKDLMELVK